jgi:predicted RNase H-like nuclease
MIYRNTRISFRTYRFRWGHFALVDWGALKFVGIDLAWCEPNPSGVAVIDANGTMIRADARLRTNAEIWEFIRLERGEGAVVTIDAPLIVRNRDRSRPVEQELTRIFWPYDAAPYPANLSNPAFQETGRIRQFVRALEQEGFVQRTIAPRGEEQRERGVA